ncbi:Chorismate mutase/prephenate dehydratase [Acididesulfobacillus acetoxydans]|uniref:Prephenate dehydratase n=1 Tax=Acididesulfobacillus acetoxydans TaxID=1561005 RepID=A0A8S0Y265_9FIRM|nr:prephenate dehydratase [Acididesulfobacillus acetoxydans]CAA7600375.1 Chorismate mutase/prephenate dehydratase [Acididesulfobacillus acetoxydans]CEJ07897.1 Prephenate dehydratase [Acididesulfobacillus acetoxydans]
MEGAKIGYLGPRGSFSEEALLSFLQRGNGDFRGVSAEGFATIAQAIHACGEKRVDWAFVPLENSTEGQVSMTLDCVAEREELLIYEEFVHPVSQCLLTLRPLGFEQIRRVYSHPQGFGQCRDFLETHLSQADQTVCRSTAEAARIVAESDQAWAAIAPRRAADLYGLQCLEQGVQDNKDNTTRFILVGHCLRELSGLDKTSLFMRIEDSPGSLCRMLQEFASRGINLTKIESRPAKGRLGEYVFFVDVDGYVFAPEMQEALWALKKNRVAIRLLGSYPRQMDIDESR